MYAELRWEHDKLVNEHAELKRRIEELFDKQSEEELGTDLVGRLQSLVQLAEERLARMHPYRDRETQAMIQMMIDELRHLINSL